MKFKKNIYPFIEYEFTVSTGIIWIEHTKLIMIADTYADMINLL